MLPTLSRLSVSHRPGGRLRHWCSSRYLRISPLHREFRHPLRDSSSAVSDALPRLSLGLPLQTNLSACAPFTPSKSEQRLQPPYYRGCWHGVSRCLFLRYRQARSISSPGCSSLSEKRFTTRRPSSRTRHGWIRLAPIVQYSLLLPPVGVGSVSQYPCGGPRSHAPYLSSPW